jgi:L-iditol 2-dehydrogenase
MKVAVYHRNSDIRIEDRSTPKIAGDEILVRMMASGICGTDVMEWYRMSKAPRVLGHEMAGVIVEVGNSVQGLKVGDRVFVSHHVPCYECDHCARENFTACEMLHKGNYDPGGFSEYIRIPAENVRYGTFILPPGISYEEGAMIEPLACVLAGQRQVRVREGQTVLVLGSGISGLLHIQFAKRRGAKVIATDVNKYRLEKAREFGADHAFDVREYSPGMLRTLNNGMLANAVVVCTGSQEATGTAFSSIERKGSILFFAVTEQDITIPSVSFWRNEISLHFSYGAAPSDLREALDLVQRGVVNVKDMITHRMPLSSIEQGFQVVAEAKNSLKVVIVPDTPVEKRT